MIAIALAAFVVAQAPPAACKADRPVPTGYSQSIKPHRLGEMPPGMLMHAVVITAGPCAIVQELETDSAGKAVWRMRTLGNAGPNRPAPIQTPPDGDR